MPIICITKHCNNMSSKAIAIRLKTPYLEAYEFLKDIKMKPANILRQHGQEMLVIIADRHRKPSLVKIKQKYF